MPDISIHALLAESDTKTYQGGTHHENFYPRSPCGERHDDGTIQAASVNFYPRSPCGERRKPKALKSRLCVISIHALLAESDSREKQIHPEQWNFYPRSPCGERPWQRGSRITYVEISIHALLAESDGCVQYCIRAREISIHALLAESDRQVKQTYRAKLVFLSTLSLRRATSGAGRL